MSAEQSWGADTVALGRPRVAATPDPTPQRRPSRGPRRRLPHSANRMIALAAVGTVALVALVLVLSGGSGSPTAPIREVEAPAPRVVVKAPTLLRRHEPRHDWKPDHKGQLEGGEREPQKASPATHEQATPEPKPSPVADAEPEPAPAAEAEPIAKPAPASPMPPAPTSPVAEFGL